MKSLSVMVLQKANEQYYLVVLFFMLYEVLLTSECQRGSNPKVWPFE